MEIIWIKNIYYCKKIYKYVNKMCVQTRASVNLYTFNR